MAERNTPGARSLSGRRVLPGGWPWLVVAVLVALMAVIALLVIREAAKGGDECGADITTERVGDEHGADVADERLGEDGRCSSGALADPEGASAGDHSLLLVLAVAPRGRGVPPAATRVLRVRLNRLARRLRDLDEAED